MTNEELIKKWEAVLDYVDDTAPALSEFQRLYRATLMENCELDYFNSNEYPENTHTPQFLIEMICEIRRSGKILNSPYDQ
jgi:hypothetical protein